MSHIKYKVINLTKDRTLGWKVDLADNFITRLRGLLGKKELAIGAGLIIRPCNSIHSLMMKFPFDAIFLNGDNVVVGLKEQIEPGRLLKPVAKAVQVVELPAGTITMTKTELGDVFQLEPYELGRALVNN